MATSQVKDTSQTAVRDVEQEPQSADEFIHYDHIGHGATPAAWTVSGTIMVASLIAGVGFIGLHWTDAWWPVIWVGAGLVPVALILGVVLKRAGYGVELDSNSVLKRGEDPRGHSGPATPDNTSGGPEKRQPESSTS